MGETFSYMYS